MPKVDIIVENCGSIFLFRPQTEKAQHWIEQNVPEGQYFGNALAVEHRYALDLAVGMQEELVVK